MPDNSSNHARLLTKKAIAERYAVSIRTITTWMQRKIIPFMKPSEKMVRFDPVQCDIALKAFETKSIFEQSIQEETGRLMAQHPERKFRFPEELGIIPVNPTGGERQGGDA